MKKIFLFFAFFASLCTPLLLAVDAQAACRPDPSKSIYCCGDTQTSVDFGCKAGAQSGQFTVTSLIITIINFMAIGVGISVVGGIIWGSLYYVTSNGNASKTQQGISIIVNSVIGLLLFMFLYAIVNFIVPGGVFHT